MCDHKLIEGYSSTVSFQANNLSAPSPLILPTRLFQFPHLTNRLRCLFVSSWVCHLHGRPQDFLFKGWANYRSGARKSPNGVSGWRSWGEVPKSWHVLVITRPNRQQRLDNICRGWQLSAPSCPCLAAGTHDHLSFLL